MNRQRKYSRFEKLPTEDYRKHGQTKFDSQSSAGNKQQISRARRPFRLERPQFRHQMQSSDRQPRAAFYTVPLQKPIMPHQPRIDGMIQESGLHTEKMTDFSEQESFKRRQPSMHRSSTSMASNRRSMRPVSNPTPETATIRSSYRRKGGLQSRYRPGLSPEEGKLAPKGSDKSTQSTHSRISSKMSSASSIRTTEQSLKENTHQSTESVHLSESGEGRSQKSTSQNGSTKVSFCKTIPVSPGRLTQESLRSSNHVKSKHENSAKSRSSARSPKSTMNKLGEMMQKMKSNPKKNRQYDPECTTLTRTLHNKPVKRYPENSSRKFKTIPENSEHESHNKSTCKVERENYSRPMHRIPSFDERLSFEEPIGDEYADEEERYSDLNQSPRFGKHRRASTHWAKEFFKRPSYKADKHNSESKWYQKWSKPADQQSKDSDNDDDHAPLQDESSKPTKSQFKNFLNTIYKSFFNDSDKGNSDDISKLLTSMLQKMDQSKKQGQKQASNSKSSPNHYGCDFFDDNCGDDIYNKNYCYGSNQNKCYQPKCFQPRVPVVCPIAVPQSYAQNYCGSCAPNGCCQTLTCSATRYQNNCYSPCQSNCIPQTTYCTAPCITDSNGQCCWPRIE